MVKYAAFLRGIGPLNPNMKNERLREVFEREGLKNVQTVISSGNVLFETTAKNNAKLETMIEKALPEQLGFNSTTIILSHAELKAVEKHHPFDTSDDPKKIEQFVAFTKHKVDAAWNFAPTVDDKGYGVLSVYDRTIYCWVEVDSAKGPELMRWLEKEFNKAITTRTWRTVGRVLKRLDGE